MNDNKKIKAKYNLNFCNVLTITFIVLKLCKVITWSWVWVFSPLWITCLLALVIEVVIFLLNR